MKNRKRREAQARGQIEIKPNELKLFVKKVKRFEFLMEDYRYQNEEEPVYVPVRKFRDDELKSLRSVMEKSNPRPQATIAQIGMHLDIMEKPEGRPINTLMALETALRAYMKEKIIQGWLFKKEKNRAKLQPALVTSIAYHPPYVDGRVRYPAYTTLRCSMWKQGKEDSFSVTWHNEDLGKDVETLLMEEGLFRETRVLVDTYLKDEDQFLDWRKRMGHQFTGKGSFEAKEDDSRWHDTKEREMVGDKLVVDDRCNTIKQRQDTDLFDGIVVDTGQGEERDEESIEKELSGAELQAAEAGFTRLPIDFFIWCFNLENHDEGWVHMQSMTPYKYRPEVKEKLILSPEHDDLIDALTADRDVLMEDIVSGKSGGTTIILQGKAGTGKTLTAEVYAEVMKCPLYRVHSGQLGIEASTVESVLKEAMKRANRWNCALLIDECDVFLRSRGDSLEHNAIVGVFLRMLEYFNGLLFLTTNRVDEIDEAILSRAIANIKFKNPGEEERARLWETLGGVYQLKLLSNKKVCQQLAKDLDCTGRDIKGLIRLAIKYSRQRKKTLTAPDIKRMAIFKGL